MPLLTDADITRMRDQLFFEGPDVGRRLSRFWLLLTLAAVIATAGVVADSTATVIGAMIVAPLMVPILGTVVAVVLVDRDNLLRCAALVVGGAAAVVAIAYGLGLLVELDVVAATNGQVQARVSPGLVDLVAALATGAVGSIALARPDISDTLPGVAIAISLVPPLAVFGLTAESGAWDEALGALLLFATNVTAILASGLVVMASYRLFRTVSRGGGSTHAVAMRRRFVASIVLGLLVVAIPLAATSRRATLAALDEGTVTELAVDWAEAAGWEVSDIETRHDAIVVRANGPLPEPSTAPLETALREADLGVDVRLELVPVTEVRVAAPD